MTGNKWKSINGPNKDRSKNLYSCICYLCRTVSGIHTYVVKTSSPMGNKDWSWYGRTPLMVWDLGLELGMYWVG